LANLLLIETRPRTLTNGAKGFLHAVINTVEKKCTFQILFAGTVTPQEAEELRKGPIAFMKANCGEA